jgi:hypothetical protein
VVGTGAAGLEGADGEVSGGADGGGSDAGDGGGSTGVDGSDGVNDRSRA